MRKTLNKRILALALSLVMVLGIMPLSTLTAFAMNAYTDIVGDFTIAQSDGATALTLDTDYTYSDGVLTVTTATPVTIGMKDGVTTTAETIVVDSTNGETAVTFKSIGIDTEEKAAITAKGANKITFAFTGDNALSVTSAGYGINVASKTPFVMTSADNGYLSISDTKFAVYANGYTSGGSITITGNLKLDINNCAYHAIYCNGSGCGSLTVSGDPVINIDTAEYAIYAYGIDISGGKISIKSDKGYPICGGNDTDITLSGSADLHILEGKGGLRSEKGKITITDSAKYKVYSVESGNKIAVADKFPLISTVSTGEVEISKDAVVEIYSANDAISGGKTSILDNAQVDIVIDTDSTYSEYALSFEDTLTIANNATVDIDVVKGAKIHGLYDSSGTVNVSGNAVVTIDGTTYKGVYVKNLNLSEKASVTVNHKGTSSTYYAVDGAISIKDTALFTATSGDYRVLGDPCTVTPAEGKAYMVKYGASETTATTAYYTATETINDKSSWRYFSAQASDTFPVTVTFDTNGGAAIENSVVNYGEKYGSLPSSAITGLSGGNKNWYLVDSDGNVTETNIKNLTLVSTARDHTLFIKRSVLAPNVSIALTVPGGISNGYQYYIPGASQRVLTATVGNMNTDILDYNYQWYNDDVAIEGATDAVLTLDGNVADAGTYKVKVTATLKDESDIIVTENTASAEKEQVVKIMHAANTLYYDANGGEGGPSSNYTGGTDITVQTSKPTREGYIFGGWNTKADGTGESYSGGVTYTFENDNGNGGCSVTLYAQWIKTYDVYVGGVQVTSANADDVLGDDKVSYDAETATLTLTDVAINNADGIGIKATGDLTISGSGSVTGSTYGIYVDGMLSITSGSVIEMTGTENCALAVRDGILTDNIIVSVPKNYAMGSVGEEDHTTYGTYIEENDEYKFIPAKTVKFEPGYVIYFDVGESMDYIEYQEIVAGGKVEKPADPTLSGYTFGGWYTDEAYTEEYDFDEAVCDNLWLYAKWIPVAADDNASSDDTQTGNDTEKNDNKPNDSAQNGTDNGEEDNTTSDTSSPQTGDHSNLWLWIALLFISGGAVITLTVVDGKKRSTIKH